MQRTFQLWPEGNHYSIADLEHRLQFRFLPQIAFESLESKSDIFTRTMQHLKSGKISLEAQTLGDRYREKIEAAYIPLVSIRKINDRIGYGLFAEEDLDLGSYIGEYTGIVRKNDRVYFEPLNHFCYEYPIPDEIGRSFVIDATQGHLTRFINHSFNPNLTPIHVFYDGFYHLIFIAKFAIKKGTQFFYDYGRNYWYLRQPPCAL